MTCLTSLPLPGLHYSQRVRGQLQAYCSFALYCERASKAWLYWAHGTALRWTAWGAPEGIRHLQSHGVQRRVEHDVWNLHGTSAAEVVRQSLFQCTVWVDSRAV